MGAHVALPGYLSEADGATLVRVRVQPRSGRDEIVGERAGALVVRVKAAPVDGKASMKRSSRGAL